MHEPRLLVLDEPTSGLDPIGRRLVRDFILGEKKGGTTVLFCTHIISDVEALCDEVAILVGGRLMRQGTVPQLVAAEGLASLEEVFLASVAQSPSGAVGGEIS